MKKMGLVFLSSSHEPKDLYYAQEMNKLSAIPFFTTAIHSHSHPQTQKSLTFKILEQASKINWEYIDKETIWNVASYNLQFPVDDIDISALNLKPDAQLVTEEQDIIAIIYFSMLLKFYFTKEIVCSDLLHYYHMNTNELIELYQFYHETQLFDKLIEQNLLRMIDINVYWLDLWLEQAIEFKDHNVVAKLMDYKHKKFGCSHEIDLL